MSKYRFKRVEKKKEEENINASPVKVDIEVDDDASKTRNFSIAPQQKANDNTFFNPFEEEAEEKRSLFSLRSFIKGKDKKEEDEVAKKLDAIFTSDVMSVEDIKTNLSEGKSFDLTHVFDKNSKSHKEEEEFEEEETSAIEADEDFDGDKDTYDVEGETLPIEESPCIEEDIYDTSDEDDDFVPPAKQKKEKIKKEKVFFEYVGEHQKEDINENYVKKGRLLLLSLILTSVFTLALIYLETKSLPHPIWLMPGKFGVLYLLLNLQFVFFTGFCIYKNIIDGAISLFTWHPNKNSITFVSLVVAVLQVLLHLIFNKFSDDVSLYSSVFALCAVITTLISYVDNKREYTSFKVASSRETKYCVSQLDETSAEFEKFSDYLPADLGMYKIEKADFLSNFFRTAKKHSPYDENYKVTIPLTVLASLVFAILSFFLTKNATTVDAFNNFTLFFMITLPLSSVATVSLPFFMTTLRLSRRESAIIGEASITEYANTSLISFKDTDVFHEKGIKVTSIKTYGKSRIDNTFVMAARIFKLASGPLEAVFNRSVIDTTSDKSGDSLLAVTENGMKAIIDSEEVFVGNKSFMEENGFESIEDAVDTSFETTNGRIMFIATGGEIIAKFYIKYALGRNFKALLDSFYSLGICMAVNTRDPNLDTKFLTQLLKDEEYPIVVVKREDIPSKEDDKPLQNTKSGIISNSSVSNMLRTFLSADKLSRLISMNTIIKYISLVFAITVVVILFLSDNSHEKISPLFIMLYQFMWSLPIIGTSLFQ